MRPLRTGMQTFVTVTRTGSIAPWPLKSALEPRRSYSWTSETIKP